MTVLGPSAIDQLVRWVEEKGKSDDWIAARLGVSPSTVAYHRLREGAMTPRQWRWRQKMILGEERPRSFVRGGKECRGFSEAEDARIQELARDNVPVGRIAKMLDPPRAPTSVRMRLMSLALNEAVLEAMSEAGAGDLLDRAS